jgi:predicted nucleic acid-binding protein
MYTLDTNAVIYYLRGDKNAVPTIDDILSSPFSIYISTISEVELFSFKHITESEKEKIEKLLRSIYIIPLDSNIARIAGQIRRTTNLKVPDSVIAATAIFTGSTILTRNYRDFKNIPNISILKI